MARAIVPARRRATAVALLAGVMGLIGPVSGALGAFRDPALGEVRFDDPVVAPSLRLPAPAPFPGR
jgi:hypothetical protein